MSPSAHEPQRGPKLPVVQSIASALQFEMFCGSQHPVEPPGSLPLHVFRGHRYTSSDSSKLSAEAVLSQNPGFGAGSLVPAVLWHTVLSGHPTHSEADGTRK